jgi:hypothetical protein
LLSSSRLTPFRLQQRGQVLAQPAGAAVEGDPLDGVGAAASDVVGGQPVVGKEAGTGTGSQTLIDAVNAIAASSRQDCLVSYLADPHRNGKGALSKSAQTTTATATARAFFQLDEADGTGTTSTKV